MLRVHAMLGLNERVMLAGRTSDMQACDKKQSAEFDYSRLSKDFSKLSKPAQRALINNSIFTPADLARKTVKEISAFHGIGPSSIPILRKVLTRHGLKFAEPR
jgi:hypothetical protein